MKIKVFKACVFCLMLIIISNWLYGVFSWKEESCGLHDLYEMEENSADVLFFGNSHCYCSISEGILWDRYGIASCLVTESGQNWPTTYYYMKEALKHQKPKVLVVETSYVHGYGTQLSNIYRNTINLKYSKEYFDNLKVLMDLNLVAENEKEKIENAIKWKVPVIHTRYKELTKEDFVKKDYRGSFVTRWNCDPYETPEACYDKSVGKIEEDKLLYLDKMIQLAKENGCQIVFFTAPYILNKEQQETYNALNEYCIENAIQYIDMNRNFKDIKFDYATDMMGENGAGSHVNYYGAEKITCFLGDLLRDEYNIANRKGENDKQLWRDMAEIQRHLVSENQLREETFVEEYLNCLEEMGNRIIAIQGVGGQKIDKKLLERLGLTVNEELNAILIDNGNIIYSSDEETYQYQMDLDTEGFIVLGNSEGKSIIYNNQIKNKVSEGICIFVYDKVLKKEIDTIGLNNMEKVVR